MLSNENRHPHTQALDDYRFTLDQMKINRLASQLIQHEHNDDAREAQNPAHPGVTRIRRIDFEKSCTLSRVNVDQECKDHNSRVASLGQPEKLAYLWEGK